MARTTVTVSGVEMMEARGTAMNKMRDCQGHGKWTGPSQQQKCHPAEKRPVRRDLLPAADQMEPLAWAGRTGGALERQGHFEIIVTAAATTGPTTETTALPPRAVVSWE